EAIIRDRTQRCKLNKIDNNYGVGYYASPFSIPRYRLFYFVEEAVAKRKSRWFKQAEGTPDWMRHQTPDVPKRANEERLRLCAVCKVRHFLRRSKEPILTCPLNKDKNLCEGYQEAMRLGIVQRVVQSPSTDQMKKRK
ncbi:MAG TPA: hypothetical protein VJC10_01120, partial [Patescibacteria group bacterium]|nr:hypothetical protein [Patescibacteria group bacterium]